MTLEEAKVEARVMNREKACDFCGKTTYLHMCYSENERLKYATPIGHTCELCRRVFCGDHGFEFEKGDDYYSTSLCGRCMVTLGAIVLAPNTDVAFSLDTLAIDLADQDSTWKPSVDGALDRSRLMSSVESKSGFAFSF